MRTAAGRAGMANEETYHLGPTGGPPARHRWGGGGRDRRSNGYRAKAARRRYGGEYRRGRPTKQTAPRRRNPKGRSTLHQSGAFKESPSRVDLRGRKVI